MSEHEDHLAFDDPAVTDPDDGAAWAEEPTDDGWSPVMGTPPPDAPPIVDDIDIVPPHEQPDDGLAPPVPDPGGELGEAPPPPPVGEELPPALPDELVADPVDLSVTGGVDTGPPMPPVEGDPGNAAPPAPGDIDLGDDGPPLPPAGGDPATDAQSPVPPMGDQSPVPSMGDPTAAPGAPGDIALDDGPPMPPVEGDGDAEPPPTGTDDGTIELPVEPGTDAPASEVEAEIVDDTSDEIVMSVNPGDERVSAAAITGAFLDEMGLDDPARERMIAILEEYGTDGSITEDELYAAFAEAGFDDTPTGGSEDVLTTVLQPDDDLPRSALVRIDGEGIGVFRISESGGVVELESLQTGSVYAADRPAVAEAWRDSGARIITAPAPAPAEVAAPAGELATKPKAEAEDDGGSGGGARNLLLAGAVLLPLAGGGAYLATRKIR
jgi:hypothetical protein